MRVEAVSWTLLGVLLSSNTFIINAVYHASPQSRRLCLFLPPALRLGLGQEESLRNDCERVGKGSFAYWEPDVTEGYQVAVKVFEAIANEERSFDRIVMWFPSVKDKSAVERLARVVDDNLNRLDLSTVKSSSWPDVPATMMELSWKNAYSEAVPKDDDFDCRMASAIANTEDWVNDTLCRLALCPYTASLHRAAIGLETAKVAKGPVIVRHSHETSLNPCRAASLVGSFWQGVSELANNAEEDVATLLIVAPESYDTDFVEFAAVCDELIEPSVKAIGATDIVGRAWFHPLYCSAEVGHASVIPGHALPSFMVEGFVDKYSGSKDSKPSSEAIARANDAVRWTPHATINLLRRSQLAAAKAVEAASANARPNAVYARNVLRIIEDETLLKDKQ